MLTEQDFLHLSSKADDSCGIAHMRINHACHVRMVQSESQEWYLGIPGMLLNVSVNCGKLRFYPQTKRGVAPNKPNCINANPHSTSGRGHKYR